MIDPATTPGQGAGEEEAGELPAGLMLAPVPVEGTGRGDHSSTAPDTPAGLATVATVNEAATATTYTQAPVSIGQPYRRPLRCQWNWPAL